MSSSQFGCGFVWKSIARRNVADVVMGDLEDLLESPDSIIGDS